MGAGTAAIVVIGNEILSGKFADENAPFLVRELRDLGVTLRRITVVPDEIDEIAQAVSEAAAHHEHVFTSGGVGPTHDDLTMEGIARAFGLGIVRHPELERQLRAFYGEGVGRNLRMADVPAGAELLPSDHPSWPVTCVRNVYILPGVPVIFRRKFLAIRERFRAAPFHTRRVYCMAEEGSIAAELDAVVAAFPEVGVGSYPRFEAEDFRVLVTLEGKDTGEVDRAVVMLCARLGIVVVRTE